MPNNLDEKSLTSAALADVIDGLDFRVQQILTSGDEGGPWREDLISEAAAGTLEAEFDIAKKFQKRFGKDFSIKEWRRRVSTERKRMEATRADATCGLKWQSRLLRSEKGTPLANVANARTALEFAPEWVGVLAYNEFSARLIAQNPLPWERAPRPWRDEDYIETAIWLQRNGVNVGTLTAREAVHAVARDRTVHPVREYLSSLQWDNQPRINSWLSDFLGVRGANTEQRAYYEAVGSRWLISAIARVMLPGCKADCCLILEGEQGIKKSTAFKVLAGEWFTDDVADLGSKDSILQVHGIWIVEIGELDSMSRAEVGRIKAFMSRATDHFRPPYGVQVLDLPRQCVFAGTVNHSQYLRDETGGRRFWPVATPSRSIDTGALAAVRDQLWAEAYARYKAGESWWLDSAELESVAAAEQADRYEGDPWDEPVDRWLKNPTQRADGTGRLVGAFSSDEDSVTVSDILTHALAKPEAQWTKFDKDRVGRHMRALGWKYMRRGGRVGREYRWYRPGDAD